MSGDLSNDAAGGRSRDTLAQGGAVRLVVLTGAGASADSGLATFRGGGGLWEGQRMEDVATPMAWARDPQLVWRFYQARRAALLDAEPNPCHRALHQLETALVAAGHGFTLITQNVDDLHQRAGSTVLPMHGRLTHLLCESCRDAGSLPAADARHRDMEHLEPEVFLPCPRCGHSPLRPDIVWFHELPYHLDEIAEVMERATHFLSVGTSGAVYPAAGLLAEARARGAQTFVNSLDEPENLHPDDVFLPGRAAEVVPEWVTRFLAARRG
ncbi:MAG TPA: NAD-dependent deacylase [Planctomycetota bacterium]|jgi:NAD-dependent deacetylase|nr:NAD-dependent deacylase [Planctomycetota bacterium]